MTRIALLATDGFEDSELETPRTRLREDGHMVEVVSNRGGEINGKRGGRVAVDVQLDDTAADAFDALVIPGGWSPDRLRTDDDVVAFVRRFAQLDRPLAAICHAGSLLIEAGIVEDRRLTSWQSIRTDLRNAGAVWVDEEVVVDENLITSRSPDDLPAFVNAIEERLDSPPSPSTSPSVDDPG